MPCDICELPDTETVLLEWATGMDARLDAVEARLALTQDILFYALLLISMLACSACLCPRGRPYKPYKH